MDFWIGFSILTWIPAGFFALAGMLKADSIIPGKEGWIKGHWDTRFRSFSAIMGGWVTAVISIIAWIDYFVRKRSLARRTLPIQ